MRSITFFRHLLVALFACTSFTANASSTAQELVGTCEYYDVLSHELGCAESSGYLTQFGAKYCRRFDNYFERFSLAGQQALTFIRACLQQELEKAPELNCSNVKAVAAESHVVCYREAHFCQMSLKDKMRLMRIVAPAILDPDLRAAVKRIEKECLIEFAHH